MNDFVLFAYSTQKITQIETKLGENSATKQLSWRKSTMIKIDFSTEKIGNFPLLRWIINAHFNRLSLAAFHPLTLWQGLSSRFLGKDPV
jgi:hypothetical protein